MQGMTIRSLVFDNNINITGDNDDNNNNNAFQLMMS